MSILTSRKLEIYQWMSPQRKLTTAEYRTMPEGPPWFELIGGRLIAGEPSPTGFHQDIVGLLYLKILPWAMACKAGLVRLAPSDVYLSEQDVLQPDLLFVARSRLSIVRDDGIYGPPDIAVEVLSPSTGALDCRKKRAIYARSGVKEYWIINPSTREIFLYRLAEDAVNPLRTMRPGDILVSSALPGLEIPVSELFVNLAG